MKKEIDKNVEEITNNMSYVLQFINTARFITSSLSNLVNNLSEGIHKIKCKYGHDDKKLWDLWDYTRSVRLFSYFAVLKNTILNFTNYFIMKIPDKQELQQIAFNHSSDIDFKNFIKLYQKDTAKPYSFLVIDATLPSDNPLHFRKIF